jgi:hypothetical protein
MHKDEGKQKIAMTMACKAAEIISIKDHLNLRRVGIERVPNQLGKRADRVTRCGIALQKVLFGMEVERRHMLSL